MPFQENFTAGSINDPVDLRFGTAVEQFHEGLFIQILEGKHFRYLKGQVSIFNSQGAIAGFFQPEDTKDFALRGKRELLQIDLGWVQTKADIERGGCNHDTLVSQTLFQRAHPLNESADLWLCNESPFALDLGNQTFGSQTFGRRCARWCG